MSVDGVKTGIPRCNTINKKVEPLMSVSKLKSTYLFGIEIIDSNQNELSNEVFQQYIDNAISMLEHELDISISPVINHVEELDYHYTDYVEWGFIQLQNWPVIRVHSLDMVFFRDEEGNPESNQTIPNQWIRVQNHDGIIRLIPNARFPANLQISHTGAFYPEVLRSSTVPHLWRIVYDHGFEDGRIPTAINMAIGYLAAIQALIVGGNLVLGAGIASSSLSIDGLSQSINTTQSAENSSYSATIKEYQNIVFGKTKDEPGLLGGLRDYYKGQSMSII